ncbi:MAG: hypothetical protein Q9196_005675 [Gyalolechia fulgens]
MPILEAKSEAFLAYIKSLQKGKGTVFQGLPRSAPYRSTDDEGQQVQAKTSGDVAVPALPKDEQAAPEDGTANAAPNTDLADNHASMPVGQSSADPSSNQRHAENKVTQDAHEFEPKFPTEEEPAANGRTSNNLTSTNAHQASFHHSELQITTRSMTTAGNTTQASTEASAATEVPATSRMPSPAPSLHPVTEESGKNTTLLSDGVAFLQALPNAAKVFQPSMRGGHNSEASPPPTANFSSQFLSANGNGKSEDGEQATQPSPIQVSPPAENFPTQSSNPFTSTKQQQQQQSPQDSNNPWAIKAHGPAAPAINPSSESNKPWAASFDRDPSPASTKPSNPAAHGPGDHIPESINAWAVQSAPIPNGKRADLKPLRYTEAELEHIGNVYRKALFDKLVEMEGKGRVVVGIVDGA